MGFLQPIFLWGLAGISIPVLIHLFSRRKSIPYHFSSIKFIKLTRKKTIRRQKLEEILVLLLRTVFVGCIFMAAAQPVSKKAILTCRESWVVLVLDDSASMAATTENPWTNLRKASEQILASLRKGTHVAVVFTGGAVIPFSTSYREIAKQIRDNHAGFHGNTLQPAIEKAFSMLEKKIGYKKLFIITDMQKTAWDKFSSAVLKKINPDITIVDVSDGEDHINLTVKNFYPLPGKNSYICEITNWSKQEVTTELKITGDGFETVKSITIPGRKTTEIEIKIDGDYQTLKAEILYPDVLAADNSFYLQKEIGGQKRVLLAGSDDSSISYTKSSVESAGAILVDTKNISELYDGILEKYRTILLVNPQRTELKLRRKIIEYVVGGGTLIYFSGDRIAFEDFNSDWAISERNEFFMPAKIVGRSEFLKPARIAWVATEHPLFSEFGDRTIDFLKTTRFNACFSAKEITGDILMKLDNGYPLLCEKRIGKGKIFLFMFTPRQPWTNFHTKPFFPVMMTVMIESLSGSVHSTFVGDAVVVKGSENADFVNIVNPQGVTNIITNNEKTAVSYTPDIPGIWTSVFSVREGHQKQIIAVNVPYLEGDLSKIPYGEVRSIFGSRRISFINKNRMKKIILAEASGGQMMMFFLEMALVILMAELILSNMFVFVKEKGSRNV
ncbi:MAG: BatA domain-containing protein [Candidatus Omnitrophica bacterium]|nr:BatA domain-containing protein [Candidatus Omnitrophota bacterium]